MKPPYTSLAISALLALALSTAGCGGGSLFNASQSGSTGTGTGSTGTGTGTGSGTGTGIGTGTGEQSNGGVNPPPVITSLSPTSVMAGALPQSLIVNGTGFNDSTTATFAGNAQLVTYISSSQISVVLNDAELAVAGVDPVIVTNPTPGGGASAPVNFLIENPSPTITSLSPASLPQGAPQQTLTINGTGFVNASSVTWNGASRSATFISPTQLTLSLAASDLATGGNVAVGVSNPSPGGGYSPTVNFAIDNPVPVISQASPQSMLLSTDQSVTLTGTNFGGGATVSFAGNGTTGSLTPTASSPTQITVTIPAALAATAGTSYTLTVVNPAPGGGSSNAIPFEIDYPAPTLSTMQPVSAPVASPNPVTVTLGGSDFNAATTVSFAGSVHASTTLNSGQISLTLSGADLAQSGIFPVTVTTPTPGGGTSNSLYFSVGAPTSSPAGIAVVPEEVKQPAGGPQTLDVAYLPMPPPPGGAQAEIDVVQLDTIDVPPFLPINGFVTDAAPYSTPETPYSTFVNVPNTANQTAVLNRIMLPVGYSPNTTVADAADGQVLVSSIGSAEILAISTTPDPSVQTISSTYTLAGITGSIEFSDYLCSGVCDLSIDQSGITAHAGAWAMTPNGVVHFNAVTGSVLAPTIADVVAGPDFGYSSSNSVWNLLNPYYQENGVAGLQLLNLAGAGTLTTLTNPVGTRPTSAVIDPGTQLSVVADEGTGANFLLNLFQAPTTSTADVPSVNFYIGSGGTNCQTRPDWTMTALDADTHLLLSGQMFAGCFAVTQLPSGPVTSGGVATTPTAPTPTLFGPITAPQGPYQYNVPWGTISVQLDPDGVNWTNGGDPYRFAVYTSVLTGKPTALFLEPQSSSNASCPAAVPGVWLSETPLTDMLNASGASGIGELSPTSMAELTTFLRIRVPTPAICGPTQIGQGTTVTKVTITGAGFVSGSTIAWDGTALAVIAQTPTSITVNLTPDEMTLGTHTVTITTDPTAFGSIGGTAQFSVQVVQGS